jgi:DNA repair exonuclease SbcCD ATPase subunit
VRFKQEAPAETPLFTSASTELATIATLQTIVPVEFFKEGGSNDILTNLENEVRAQAAKLDISTKAGRDAIASLAHKVACSKKPLENLRKGLTEDIRKQKEAIDAEGRKADERLEALKIEVRKPLTDWENAEKERVANHEAALHLIEDEEQRAGMGWTVEEIESKIALVKQIFNSRSWQEFIERASKARIMAVAALEQALFRAQEAIREKEELERLRAEAAERAIKEREEASARAAKEAAERRAEEQARIAREAVERERQRLANERAEAEARAKQAEAEKIAAELRAEALRLAEAESYQAQLEKERREAEEAEERAQQALRDAEARRVAEAEAAELAASAAVAKAERERYAAVEAERQRVAARQKEELEEAEKRAKNRAHRLKIDNEVLGAIVALDIPMDRAQDLLIAIAKNEIPNICIQY